LLLEPGLGNAAIVRRWESPRRVRSQILGRTKGADDGGDIALVDVDLRI
jgi:hypothetical protein